jgi:plasmid stabilization system protein ParE
VAIRWTRSAYADLKRIHEFLEPVDSPSAARAVRSVVARVRRIPRQPRLGERVPGFGDREVRRVLIQKYEVRYEVAGTDLTVLRIFHTREDR